MLKYLKKVCKSTLQILRNNLSDDPRKKRVIMKCGTMYPEQVVNHSKSPFSVMFRENVVGDVVPSYTVFKSVHLYEQWVVGGLKGAHYNRTQSGWFDEETFNDWIFSMALPKLCKQDGKKVMIGNNLSSHLSDIIIQACQDHNIAFTCLSPNATHLLQLLDVAFYAPLKKAWQSILQGWKMTSKGRKHVILPRAFQPP